MEGLDTNRFEDMIPEPVEENVDTDTGGGDQRDYDVPSHLESMFPDDEESTVEETTITNEPTEDTPSEFVDFSKPIESTEETTEEPGVPVIEIPEYFGKNYEVPTSFENETK